ncbi:small-conductance mechanosensitive channel [Leptolyngbya sp. Heron Island J]|uniref:cyclic nucleotide-binding domain-containing protein n=1 Tax=Leptolyngbya sp. Heron Island J TaxID=1385935 RepID=UPI0003B991CE|nr:cyclic nucleotide-binding domain-containing protein [Leptolyngbya sp. Heron Island J]ESA32810.1 small-conductance mechanosensitive channel [Leptolyngbya sp. Heron Island J]
MTKDFISWLLLLGIGFPLLGVALNEIAERLEQQQPELASALRKILRYVLPPLALLLVMRQLLQVASTAGPSRLVETITWIAIIVAGVFLINATLTNQKPERQFQVQIPNLFFQAARAIVVLGIGYYLITGIWDVDISSLTTAVGVGSLVFALALQNTLSNLVSGLLLLVAKPFEVGDWISFDGSGARVIDQSWWSVTVDNGFAKRSVPNATLSGASISNLGKGAAWDYIQVGLSYDDPPNQVLLALSQLPEGVKEVEPGSAFPAVSAYGDCSITYDLWFLAVPGLGAWVAKATLLSKFYYMVQREGFTIPYPMVQQYQFRADDGFPSKIPQAPVDRQQEMFDYLRSLSYLFSISDTQLEQLAGSAQFHIYGTGDLITQEGKSDSGLYAVYSGRVMAQLTDSSGNVQTTNRFGIGDVFGEMAIYPGEVSPIATVAEGDVELVVVPAEDIVELIRTNSKFAAEILQFIEERKKSIQVAKVAVTTALSNGHQMPVC